MMAAESDFTRTLEDPVTFLRLRALVLAPQLGVPIEVMDRRLSIVISALGAEWLNEAAGNVPEAIPLPFPRHYLGHLVGTAGEAQIGELLELGQYLEELHAVRGLDQAIPLLKSGYHQTLLQLAMATRFQLVGAKITRLEPPATDGRFSDIELAFKDMGYQVECYRPTFKGGNEQAHELVRFEQGVLEKARRASRPYAVAVAFTEQPTPQLRREAVGVVGQAIRDIDAESEIPEGHIPSVLLHGPGVVVSVVPTIPTRRGSPPVLPRDPEFPQKGNDYASYMRVGVIPHEDAAGIYADGPTGVGTSCVGVWVPTAVSRRPADPAAIIEKFGRKIEKKMVQARSDRGHSRIIVVDAWEADRVREADEALRDRLRGKLIRAHSNVAAILLTHREWTDHKLRHTYPLLAITGETPSTSLELLLRQLVTIDAA